MRKRYVFLMHVWTPDQGSRYCRDRIESVTKELAMRSISKYVAASTSCAALTVAIAFAAEQSATSADKYSLKVPGGLAFSEFKGYESWEVIAVSHNGDHLAAILGNPAMINAYKAGIPDNGKPFPDGAKMAKIHWNATKKEIYPGQPWAPGKQSDVDFMVKDSKRFADSGGWGYAAFDYDATSDTFTPGTTASKPPQENDAKCGFGCHTLVKDRDYVFTEYGHR